jgi:hypothetical protein
VGEVVGAAVVEAFIDDGIGQPLADIDFTARLRRLHSVEAEPRHHGAEIAARLIDRRVVDAMPAQISVLHHVLGLGARAEHAISEARQRAPMRLEIDRLVFVGDARHAA